MLEAIILYGNHTLVCDLPQDPLKLQNKLNSIGISLTADEKAVEVETEKPQESVRSTWKENYLQGLALGGGSALAAVLLWLGIVRLKKRRKHHEV